MGPAADRRRRSCWTSRDSRTDNYLEQITNLAHLQCQCKVLCQNSYLFQSQFKFYIVQNCPADCISSAKKTGKFAILMQQYIHSRTQFIGKVTGREAIWFPSSIICALTVQLLESSDWACKLIWTRKLGWFVNFIFFLFSRLQSSAQVWKQATTCDYAPWQPRKQWHYKKRKVLWTKSPWACSPGHEP